MTHEEQDLRLTLSASKRSVKEALVALDPSPAEPLTAMVLAALDALDVAIAALDRRAARESGDATGRLG